MLLGRRRLRTRRAGRRRCRPVWMICSPSEVCRDTPFAHLPVVPMCRTPSPCAVGQITSIFSRIPPHHEGRIAIVTKREAGSGGRDGDSGRLALDTDGEVVWSWRPMAGAKLAEMLRISPMTVTTKSGSPGRVRSKP